ncbi:MAG: CADD family putative folate metabolism protein [Bryobacteraceae bacterium]
MPTLIEQLNERIDAQHLLKHPFYVAWANGELTLEDLRLYSARYFAHVKAFPAYLSEMHSRCEDLDVRKIVAGNLAEEEGGTVTHPELWLDFAAALGADGGSIRRAPAGLGVRELIETYRDVARLETGLAAVGLYCYEKQVPAVSASKIAGLKQNYGVTDEAALRYFSVHETADVKHSAEWEAVIDRTAPDAEQALAVAGRVLAALWGALDGIYAECRRKYVPQH